MFLNSITTSGLLLYATAATCVTELLTSSLLTSALRNRLIRSQFLRPILPDESMIKAISSTERHSLSDEQISQHNWNVLCIHQVWEMVTTDVIHSFGEMSFPRFR